MGADGSSGGSRVPIVAAVDGSDSAKVALNWAAQAARREDRPLHIVTVLEPIVAGTARPILPPEIYDWLHEGAARIVEQAAGTVRSTQGVDPAGAATGTYGAGNDVIVTTEVAIGNPAPVLRELSSRAHSIVVGSRGVGGVKGLLLGSVSAHLHIG